MKKQHSIQFKQLSKSNQKKSKNKKQFTGDDIKNDLDLKMARETASPMLNDDPIVPMSQIIDVHQKNILEKMTLKPAGSNFSLLFSYSLGKQKAQQLNLTASTAEEAWGKILKSLEKREKKSLNDIPARWIRLDWITESKEHSLNELKEDIQASTNGYYDKGIALDKNFEHAFLEAELNANGILYTGSVDKGQWQSQLNEQKFKAYAQKKYGNKIPLNFTETTLFYTFQTKSLFITANDIHEIKEGSRYRNIAQLNEDNLNYIIFGSKRFLASQIQPTGRFVYGIVPQGNRTFTGYNAMRHVGAVYSLMDAGSSEDQTEYWDSIRLAISYAVNKLTSTHTIGRKKLTFLVDGNEIKAGGIGLCLLMLVKYTELTNDQRYSEIMKQLAEAILHIQQPDGSFIHVLDAGTLEVKETYRTIYYDGEATFGLMRYYALTKEKRWLDANIKAFDYFCEKNHWKAHDHWLAYALNEVTKYVQDDRYFELGLKNVFKHLNFILERETYYPTLGELVMASYQLIERIQSLPEKQHLLQTYDIEKFHRALEYRMHYLLEGFYWPEIAMFFDTPFRIVGSFYLRHHEMRTRIDDVQHYLSGYVAYSRYFNSKYGLSVNLYDSDGVLTWGGDVNLGRRQHYRSHELGFNRTLIIPELKTSDLTIVNLECVVSTLGEQGVAKGEGGPYYYRARPEMLRVLTDAGVNFVTVANNHSGDYGTEALLQQQEILNQVGIGFAGSGVDAQDAFSAKFCRVGDVDVALFSIDSTQKRFAALKNKPGTAFLPPDNSQVWFKTLQPLISDAKKKADLVVVAVHWGANNLDEPIEEEIAIGHAIVDAGADAVLGASAHRLQGVELYNNKPIIHDAGDLLFDAIKNKLSDSGVFQLGLTKKGIGWLRFVPVGSGFGQSIRLRGSAAEQLLTRYEKKCSAMGSVLDIRVDDAYIRMAQPLNKSREYKFNERIFNLDNLNSFKIESNFTQSVPQEYSIEPVDLLGIKLLGIRVYPTHLNKREMIYVETWWCTDKLIDENLRLDYQTYPKTQKKMPNWGISMDHDPSDWMIPTKNWKKDQVYRDFYGIRPPSYSQLINDEMTLKVRVIGDNLVSESYVYPYPIKLDIESLNKKKLSRDYRTDFSGINLNVEPGQTWTAVQLASITGGKWLSSPPEGWFVRSVVNVIKNHVGVRESPIVFVAHTNEDRNFHEQYSKPLKSLQDRHLVLAKHIDLLDGAIVSKPVKNLPKDFPLLLVDDPIKAIMELGFAARQRFQGNVIAVTGTAGKSSTISLLETLFDPGTYIKNIDNYNSRVGAPLQLASLAPDHKVALIEVAQAALWMKKGPITQKIKPTISVLTEIGLSQTNHMVKTTEDVAKWKSKIFDGLTENGVAVFGDHLLHFDFILKEAKKHTKNIVVYGRTSKANIRVLEQKLIHSGSLIKLNVNSKNFEISLPFSNKGMINNALAAISVAYVLGMDLIAASERIVNRYKADEGRLETYLVNINNVRITVIDDSWNAEVISMLNAFSELKDQKVEGKKIAVLGRIVNLGDRSPELHASLANPLKETGVDLVLTHGDEMIYMRDQLPKKMMTEHFNDAHKMFESLKSMVSDGDVVLLKGSRRDSDFGEISSLLKKHKLIE